MAERESVPAREYEEVDGLDHEQFGELTAAYAKASLMERKGKRIKESLKVKILALMACAGIDQTSEKEDRSLKVGDYRITVYGHSSSRLSDELLLKKGVAADIIADCYIESSSPALNISGGELDEDSEAEKEKKAAAKAAKGGKRG